MEQKSSAVVCRNKKELFNIQNIISNIIQKQIDNNVSMDDESKERIYQRFVEIYERSLLENLSSGTSETEQDTTEVQPISDELKEKEANLMQEIDSLVLTVAKKRKHCPHQTAVQLAKTCRAQCSYLKKAKAEAVVPEASISPEDDSLAEQPAHSIKTTATKLNKTLKGLPELVTNAEELQKAQVLHNQLSSSTDKLLCSL